MQSVLRGGQRSIDIESGLRAYRTVHRIQRFLGTASDCAGTYPHANTNRHANPGTDRHTHTNSDPDRDGDPVTQLDKASMSLGRGVLNLGSHVRVNVEPTSGLLVDCLAIQS
jgi:hypothetical protein